MKPCCGKRSRAAAVSCRHSATRPSTCKTAPFRLGSGSGPWTGSSTGVLLSYPSLSLNADPWFLLVHRAPGSAQSCRASAFNSLRTAKESYLTRTERSSSKALAPCPVDEDLLHCRSVHRVLQPHGRGGGGTGLLIITVVPVRQLVSVCASISRLPAGLVRGRPVTATRAPICRASSGVPKIATSNHWGKYFPLTDCWKHHSAFAQPGCAEGVESRMEHLRGGSFVHLIGRRRRIRRRLSISADAGNCRNLKSVSHCIIIGEKCSGHGFWAPAVM